MKLEIPLIYIRFPQGHPIILIHEDHFPSSSPVYSRFVIIERCEPRYYLYLGSMDITSLEVLERIQEMAERSKTGGAPMSCFEFIQLIN